MKVWTVYIFVFLFLNAEYKPSSHYKTLPAAEWWWQILILGLYLLLVPAVQGTHISHIQRRWNSNFTSLILRLPRSFFFLARNMHFQTKLTLIYPSDSTQTTTAALGNLGSLQQVQPTPVLLHRYIRACKTGWYMAPHIAVKRGVFSLMHPCAIMCCSLQQSFLFKILLPSHITSKDQ